MSEHGYIEIGRQASRWSWDHRGIANGIVAYRIVKGTLR